MVQPLLITADEVNCLIHSYLQDSGFVHSAFVLHAEGQLNKSAHFGKHVPRGELVELLSKALLYSEVEAHWRGNAMTTNCKTPFSILEPHVCSLDPTLPSSVQFNPPPPSDIPVLYTNGTNGTAEKRKASTPASEEAPKEKRARTEDMEVDSVTSSTEQPLTDARLSAPEQAVAGPSGSNETLQDETPANAISRLLGHNCEVYVCSWNPTRHSILATGAKDASIRLWDVQHPQANPNGPPESDSPIIFDYQTASDKADLTSLDWNHDGTLLAAGSYDAILRVCDASGQLYFSETMQKGPVFATRFSTSGRYLLTASLDGSVCVWDVNAKALSSQYICHDQCCLDVEWLSEDIFATAGADAKIQIMKLGISTPLRTLSTHTSEVNQLKCNPSQTRLASCSDDATARIFDVASITNSEETEATVMVLSGHSHTLSTISWCPRTAGGEHEMLLSASFDGTARLWDTVTGDCLAVFSDHVAAIYTTSFCPDGRFFATAGGDGQVNVYDVKRKERIWTWRDDSEKRAIFEIDWQYSEGISRLALALEFGAVGVFDMARIPALQ